MTVIRTAEARRTETPNAVMTTFASATQGGSQQAVWRVDMDPGAAGPVHAFDAEQVWTVLDGGAHITLDGETSTVAAGDTVIMPADVPRQIRTTDGLAAIVCAPATTRVHWTGAVPACASADGAKILPGWVA
ncbi:cupin domain-containing protein [Amycolatopsis benzoatilytica]|uniref:cupin domain-containing protein n=1 Tax=Amycolatopsis benzoatilytica TaxID=346045 RepID=UPI00037B5C75|nr:cupin domain-containing protein [Amycolatopsis benzoatilytica]